MGSVGVTRGVVTRPEVLWSPCDESGEPCPEYTGSPGSEGDVGQVVSAGPPSPCEEGGEVGDDTRANGGEPESAWSPSR